MRHLRGLVTLLVVAGLAGLALFSPRLFGDPDLPEDLYVEGNERLLARIGSPAGAREVDRYTRERRASGIATGWRTTVVYAPRAPTAPADVLGFYRARLRRWSLTTTPPHCLKTRRTCHSALFVRGLADVLVDASSLGASRPTFRVTADYAGGGTGS